MVTKESWLNSQRARSDLLSWRRGGYGWLESQHFEVRCDLRLIVYDYPSPDALVSALQLWPPTASHIKIHLCNVLDGLRHHLYKLSGKKCWMNGEGIHNYASRYRYRSRITIKRYAKVQRKQLECWYRAVSVMGHGGSGQITPTLFFSSLVSTKALHTTTRVNFFTQQFVTSTSDDKRIAFTISFWSNLNRK